MKPILLYYLALNLIAFVLYGADKLFAKRGTRRVPERTLLGLAALGGAFGALLGMYFFRHKTRHRNFTLLVPLFAALHTALLLFLLYGPAAL